MKFRVMLFIGLVVAVVGVVAYREAAQFKLGRTKMPVNAYTRQLSPIIVVARSRSGQYTAFWRRYDVLNDVARDFPDYSFTIPEGMDKEIESQLRRQTQPNVVTGPSAFRVQRRSDGSQYIIAFYPVHDGMNCDGVWYIARRHQVFPKYFDGFVLMYTVRKTMPGALVATAVLWLLSTAALGRLRRSNRSDSA